MDAVNTLSFERLDPPRLAYPRPTIPMLPVLGRLQGPMPFPVDSRFLAGDARFMANGRSALFHALMDAGIGAGDEVLVPAYHCPSLVLPVPAVGATPVFYSPGAELDVDVETLAAHTGPRTRALVLTHYFGWRQAHTEAIANWCRQRGLLLIEDCAHSFYARQGQPLPGALGDYAIASSRKFFPGNEGGLLVKNRGELALNLAGCGLRVELKAAYDSLHLAVLAGRLAALRPLFPTPIPAVASAIVTTGDSRYRFDRAIAGRRGNRVSAWLMRHCAHALAAARRRQNYQRWLTVVAELPGIRAWRPELPDTLVPYVFPALLERPARDFPALKQAGLPIWRWDELARTACVHSRDLGVSLLQLPCHQSLTDMEMTSMLETLRQVLSAPGAHS